MKKLLEKSRDVHFKWNIGKYDSKKRDELMAELINNYAVMTEETHQIIRKKMTACGVWNYAINMKIYTTDEFVNEFGDKMPEDLINLLKTNIGRLQYYLDERILEPLS